MNKGIVYKVDEIKNFRELIERTTKRYPQNVAYKFKNNILDKEPIYEEKTYSNVKEDVKKLGTALLNLGLENKKVALISNNRYEWCISYLGVTTSNIVIVPLDKALPEKEIESLIIRSEAEAVIFEDKYQEIFDKIKEKKESKLKHYIIIGKTNEKDKVYFDNLLKNGEKLLDEGDKQYDNIKVDAEKMSIMLFTSGTTDKPKAVMLSQKNICSNVTAIAQHVKLYPEDTLLSFLPLHHTFECTITFLYGFYFGVTVAFCDGLKYIAKNLEEYRVSVFVAVPLVLETIYKKILKGIDDLGKTKLINKMIKVSNILLKFGIDIRRKVFKSVIDKLGGNLRIALFGAAPMDKDIIVGYNNFGIKTIQGYGLTETSPVIATETDKDQRPGSIGYPLANLDVKIEDKDEYGVGEIVVKGPSVMIGYYNNEKETQKVLKDGWFSTGDLGYFDNDGFLYVTGRKKDLIVLKNGKNIYPQELEFLINKMSFVEESMVYAKKTEKGELLIGAKIVYNEERIKEVLGEKTEEEYKRIIWEEIKKINQTIPNYKHIKEIKITKEPLEKTTTQKVKRYEEMKKVEQLS